MLRLTILTIALLVPVAPIYAQTADDLFDDSILHEIRIDVRSSDWDDLRINYLENTYYAADMRWLFKGAWVDIPQVGIRSRGNGSRSPIKPGLLVDFDRYNSSRQFLGLPSLVLRNNAQDASMLRERLAFKLMRQLGIPAPRTAHARLYVNDEYLGVYMMVENIDKAFLRNRFAEENGYLYEYEWVSKYSFEHLGTNPSSYCPAPFEPDTHESSPACEVIEAMIRTVNQAPDAQFQQLVTEFLDLNSFVAQIAVEAYVAERDGIIGDWGMNNFYLYRHPGSNRFEIIPWDKSLAFDAVDRWVMLNTDVNVLSRRALTVPALRDLFAETLSRTATIAGGPGGWLEQETARAYGQIRNAALEDTQKQCGDENGHLKTCTNEDFEEASAFMIRFARERSARVTDQMGSYTIVDGGGMSVVNGGSAAGYARIHPNDGSMSPAGLAIFGFRQNGVLVTEASVPATAPLSNGRIYAEVNGARLTGLAIANPNAQPATIRFYFTDAMGQNSAESNVTIPSGGKIARFLNEAPFNGGPAFSGSFTFISSVPVAAVSILGFTNEVSNFLITTLPVTDLLKPEARPSIVPHVVNGAGWSTDLILVNPTDAAITGTAQFASGQSLGYSIAARSSVRLATSGTGWIRLVTSNPLPVAGAIFTYQAGGVTVTQAGVPAISSGSAFRMYVEASNQAIRSGVAIANSSNAPVEVHFELTALSGASTGLTGSVTIPANGHAAKFLDEIPGLQMMPDQFQGVLRVLAAGGNISLIGLRGRTNEAGNFLITTTPPVMETAAPSSGELFFPHFVNSGGYTTQFILYSAYPGQKVLGRLEYLSQSGAVLNLRPQE